MGAGGGSRGYYVVMGGKFALKSYLTPMTLARLTTEERGGVFEVEGQHGNGG